MPSLTQIKDGVFQLVAIFCALLVAYVCVNDDGLNKPVSLSPCPCASANHSSLCISAKSYNMSAIKLLFCSRDVKFTYSTELAEVDNDAFNTAWRSVRIKRIGSDGQPAFPAFFDEVDSFARSCHFTDTTFVTVGAAGGKNLTKRTKTVHLSPFASVCLQPCTHNCTPVEASLVFNTFFASVFAVCLAVALILRILAHRCWRFLSTSVMSVRRRAAQPACCCRV